LAAARVAAANVAFERAGPPAAQATQTAAARAHEARALAWCREAAREGDPVAMVRAVVIL